MQSRQISKLYKNDPGKLPVESTPAVETKKLQIFPYFANFAILSILRTIEPIANREWSDAISINFLTE